MSTEEDPFDSLLSLEDEFYKEGYELGMEDGARAGLIDGRLFGLENGFEKYVAMGALHGRATVWAGRLPNFEKTGTEQGKFQRNEMIKAGLQEHIVASHNTRLKIHIRTLYALTEPGSLSVDNSEHAVADFDDRLKRAQGKIKVLERLIGESRQEDQEGKANDSSKPIGDGGIEDSSVLNARH